ncbi:MAG: hypothetical protein A2107_09050 [Verrucomicrobia bacterium GWF2_62_7]|nr:MAG: hypothetical protein A2107_09050 [Verrucomicrobia bacterium GWF2_62_7]
MLRQGASRPNGGQAMVESVFVIMLLCLIFWGFLQAALLYNHERVLQFASFASARSATVGFNQETYLRAYRAAAIPASGTMRSPGQNMSQMDQLALETIIIPLYLNRAVGGNMDYGYWDQYNMRPIILPDTPAPRMLEETHVQEHPLEMPMVGAFYRLNRGTNATVSMMQNTRTDLGLHYEHYLQ